MRGTLAWLAALGLLASACSDKPLTDTHPPAVTTPPESTPATTPSSPAATTSEPAPTPEPQTFEKARAMAHVRHLAGDLGPRLATGSTFREAASYVATEFAAQGYDVARQGFPVPAGESWGVPVEAGRSVNVVATPRGFDSGRPYRLVGAHLDTIAVAPGAEDNASGIAVLLELARVFPGEQVVLVAFGAEEPVGSGDLHHFGSKHYVAQMSTEERRNLEAMVSLDRVGVGDVVPLAAFSDADTDVRDELARVADRLRIPTTLGFNTTSDHESFVVEGLPAARIGGTDYDEYHSEADLPSLVQAAQLERVCLLLSGWLRSR